MRSELYNAAHEGNLAEVLSLLVRGVDVDYAGTGAHSVTTPLLAATRMERVDVARALVLRGGTLGEQFGMKSAQVIACSRRMDSTLGRLLRIGPSWCRFRLAVLQSTTDSAVSTTMH